MPKFEDAPNLNNPKLNPSEKGADDIDAAKKLEGELTPEELEKLKTKEGQEHEGKIEYTANLEGIMFIGIIDFPWHGHGEKRDVLRMDGFDFGIFGNEILCNREQFSEMAQKIAEVKIELDKGNRQPWFKFMTETFYVTKKSEPEG